MSLKLLSASVVMLVGIVLASLFPKSEHDAGEAALPAGVALRRDAPRSAEPDTGSAARGVPLPAIEAAVTTRSEADRYQIRFVPTGGERSPFRSPPPMAPEYRTAATERAPETAGPGRERRLPADRTPSSGEPEREILHRVVDGDTLPALAARYLGDAALADRIWETNRERLPENPNWLPIGVELQIPPRTAQPSSELADVGRARRAETRLVPITPAPVIADTQAR